MTASERSSALYRLLTWLSPSYPVGAYAYSHGLESAVEAGLVADAEDARLWIADLIALGSGGADLVFAAAAHRAHAEPERLRDVAEYAIAFQPTAELRLESAAQGDAFMRTTTAAAGSEALERLRACWPGPYAYPVAVGAAAAGESLPLAETLTAFAHAFAANLVSAAIRLVPLGHTDGQRLMARLEPVVHGAAGRAAEAGLDAVASCTINAEILSMRHETQHTRLFRS